jgi:hypothetical protein
MQYRKQKLLAIARKIKRGQRVTPQEITYLSQFERMDKDSKLMRFIKAAAVPSSILLGISIAMFPSFYEQYVSQLPAWTNLTPELLTGIDYMWNILSEPVGKANIVYHIPNIVLYSFGVVGVKKIIDAVDRRTWLEKVMEAQDMLQDRIDQGNIALNLRNGHSLLFVGNGDFIGMQFVISHDADNAVTISQTKPAYTDIWNYYNTETLYEDLKDVIIRCDGEFAGEYVFFPVKDDQIFLPGEKAYDLSPHKLDIICQDIRMIEKEKKWKPKRIIIIGDKFHKSYVQSEDDHRVIPGSGDTVSLSSIAKKYEFIAVLDPSDIVLKKIIAVADGRKIVFRATKEGIKEYKKRFYDRLKQLRYMPRKGKKGILTIGYDLFEDQTEQQTLSRKIDDYLPVVLSKNVHDALIRNGHKKSEFLYVPDLVLQTLSKTAAEQ